MSKIHLEILDKERQEVFRLLSHFKKFGYLAGGTALALQIKHRKSFDFDVFVNKPISNLLKITVKEVFGDREYYVNSKDQISFRTKENINVTFLWYYFKPLFSSISTESIPLSHYKDIAADKAYTLGRRAIWRDYVDFFCLFKGQFINLEETINFAKKKFGGELNEALFLQQLSYFKDVEAMPIEFVEEQYSESAIKSFLEDYVAKYIENIRI